MALFRRGKRAQQRGRRGDEPLNRTPGTDPDDDEDRDPGHDDVADASGPGAGSDGGPGRPAGPWDVEDVPDGGPERIDLGSLQVPLNEGAEVRVEVSAQGEVVAAIVMRGQSSMQVQAFAAPRTEGIWAEVRQEIARTLAEGGGRTEEAEGPLGVELRGQILAQAPDGGPVLAPARFLGVDGPRWFLRALINGPAAQDEPAAEPLIEDFRGVVVVRGSEAMVVRDLLPLRLPADVQQAAEQAAQAAGRVAPAVPERGPEITEIR